MAITMLIVCSMIVPNPFYLCLHDKCSFYSTMKKSNRSFFYVGNEEVLVVNTHLNDTIVA